MNGSSTYSALLFGMGKTIICDFQNAVDVGNSNG